MHLRVEEGVHEDYMFYGVQGVLYVCRGGGEGGDDGGEVSLSPLPHFFAWLDEALSKDYTLL
jgi:hypothetical protein